MLQLKFRGDDQTWPNDLDPNGEEFELWWTRNGDKLAQLHPRIVEQWVHRHWDHSPFRFIPLETLEWRLEAWPTERVLSAVHLNERNPPDPVHDYARFTRFGPKATATARGWNNGTWDYPIVVLETPFGVSTYGGDFPDARFVLIEGHLRWHYLHGLAHRQVKTGPHKLFILRSSVTSE
ncbi:hypothetical protein [Cystobacter fuscus]|uniref:hypothetical protein n=1 Tax=Cystobacter fuscus TaxID=43 RepID=UPI002B3200B6|nr:hypothetical protein F0U63_20705 [Cystobacter fuscus]